MGELHAVILAGGSGTRFWPLSRETMPKQLLRVLGGRSLLAETVQRGRALVPEGRIWVVTSRLQAPGIRAELHRCGAPGARLLVEPAGRNTAAAIALAAASMAGGTSEAVMAVFPADHHVEAPDRFLDRVREAQELARAGWLVTFGIRPTRADTGFGYIRRGEPLDRGGPAGVQRGEAYRVAQFTEKPDAETAGRYVASGEFVWNSGVFVWRADRFMEELARFLPVHCGAVTAMAQAGEEGEAGAAAAARYAALPSVSVDAGILEHSDRVAVMPADVGWSDVGSWPALRAILPRDAAGNVLQGDVLAVDSRDCLIRSDGRLVAALGLEGMVVVDTPDALLVCPEARSQEVRGIAEGLRDAGRPEALEPMEVPKPWGAFRVVDRASGYQVKWLDVAPGQRLSLQSHRHRDEHWVVVHGQAQVTLDGQELLLCAGGHVLIPRGVRHRVGNLGPGTMRLIEVQIGEYLGEDDIVRHEDDYGRLRGA